MKQLILTLALALTLAATADAQGVFSKKTYQGRRPLAEYLRGAVPVEDGQVVWHATLPLGKSPAEAFRSLKQWASLRYTPLTQRGEWNAEDYFKNFEYASVTTADDARMVLECKGDEELVFSNKILERDATRISYTLNLRVEGGNVVATLHILHYLYALTDQTQRLDATDWITDEEAFSKKGTLLRRVARFRIKTIDMKDRLFKEIGEAVK